MTGRQHDVELIIKDFDSVDETRGPSGKDVVWHRVDNRSIQSPDELEAHKKFVDEANERYEIDELEPNTVVAHIWLTNRAVSRIKWVLDEHEEAQ